MQRLILQSLPRHRAARYRLFHIPDDKVYDAQRDLEHLLKFLATADPNDKKADEQKNVKVCIAFTWKGLQKFGLNEENLHNVPLAFREGMANDIRCARLKDTPEEWDWSDARGVRCNEGQPDQSKKDIHVLVAAFCKVDKKAEIFDDEVVNSIQLGWNSIKPPGGFEGLECIYELPDAFQRADAKGHFGFRDGISQPYIAGSGTSKKPIDRFADAHIIKPGEFILGHRNEFAQHLPALWIAADNWAAATQLKQEGLEQNQRDFGRNGSYLVFRQIQQKKDAFERFLETAASESVPGAVADKELIAAKLVGRWRSGAPLALSPEKDDVSMQDANDFLYDRDDRYGYKCPVGSHIRRSYPRDSKVEQGSPINSERTLASHRRRRLIRRGRPYYDLDDDKNVGLHFICLNADIREQFEFIQESWINNQRFGSTRDEVDPIVGSGLQSGNQTFTIQRSPISQSLSLQNFVKVVGGAYFFLPSVRALNFLAEMELKSSGGL